MPLSEFEVIRRYFMEATAVREDILLGVGDDAALLRTGSTESLALCMDTMVAGVHFPDDAPPETIGYKALAVNLSDLAAMGARPAWALLALTVPNVEEGWLVAFSAGFYRLARMHDVALVGGDTTRGPLAVTINAAGWVDEGLALRRSGARPGDGIYVTGTLGDAALGLRLWRSGQGDVDEHARQLVERLHRPVPRVRMGRAVLGIASAAIDISDCLCADLGHILKQSGVGAVIESGRLPLSAAMLAKCRGGEARHLALTGGDDYELCLTAAPAVEAALVSVAATSDVPLTRIGRIEAQPGLRILAIDGRPLSLDRFGFDHFGSGAP
jgi:thiamine-monophosphate kinase